MEFIRINEKEYTNEQYLVRSYSGEHDGSYKSTYDAIKNNCINTKKHCLVEIKTYFFTLAWDFDFKPNLDKLYLDNYENIINYIISKINEVLDEYIITPNKDFVYAVSTNGKGVHIYYVFLIVDKKLSMLFYHKVMEKIEKEKIYNIETMKKIIDKSVCDYNGIRLFGCIKDGGYYYPVKDKSTFYIFGNLEQDFNYCLLNKNTDKYNFQLKIEIPDNNINTEKIKNNTTNNIKKENNFKINDDSEKINELLDIIKTKNKDYQDWIDVGMSLHTLSNTNDMMNIWYEWSCYNYNCNYNEIVKKWNSLNQI